MKILLSLSYYTAESFRSPLIKIGFCTLGACFMRSPLPLGGIVAIAICEKAKLIRELAALFLSLYYPLPTLLRRETGKITYDVQSPLQRPSPGWCSGRHFLDRIVTLENGAVIYLGALPMKKHANWLKEQLCHHIFSMIEEKEYDVSSLICDIVYPKDWAKEGFQFHHFPSEDFTPLRLETLKKATETALLILNAGQSIYVHCKAGRGRSSALVAALICLLFDKKVEESMQILRSARPQVTLDKEQQKPIESLLRKMEE